LRLRRLIRSKFDVCVIDEAGKARPTETLVPMVRARRWVLVGDSRQLPPFLGDYQENPDVCDDFCFTEEDQKQTFLSFLEDSLPESAKVFLDTQYRMCKPIGRLISGCFYHGSLKSVRDFTFRHLVASRAVRSPVTWFSTERMYQKYESRQGVSFYNKLEVAETEKILGRIGFAAHAEGKPITVACITPYTAQIDMLERMIDRNAWEGVRVKIGTIDSFQGRQADVVVLSLVRSNPHSDLGFLCSSERINVALSRAREVLVIIGDALAASSQVEGHPLRTVLEHIRKDDDCALEKLSD
jgi:superfamily I DNA and/or RNA helicase